MTTDLFDRGQVWHTEGIEETKSTSRRTKQAVAGAMVGAMLLCGILGYRVGHAPVDGLQGTRAVLRAHVQNLSELLDQYKRAAIQCRPYDGVAGNVRQLIARGQFGTAAALAEMYLGSKQHLACPGSALTPLWYTASMDTLYSTPVGSPLDPTPVLRWQGIQAKATRFGLGQGDQDSALTVFTYAYQNGIWPLARAAFVAAVKAQLVSADDRTSLAKYYATLRNMGHNLTFDFHGNARRAGLRLLATANAIGGYLGRGEAGADLTTVFGANRHHWPRPDRTDPVLAALQH